MQDPDEIFPRERGAQVECVDCGEVCYIGETADQVPDKSHRETYACDRCLARRCEDCHGLPLYVDEPLPDGTRARLCEPCAERRWDIASDPYPERIWPSAPNE